MEAGACVLHAFRGFGFPCSGSYGSGFRGSRMHEVFIMIGPYFHSFISCCSFECNGQLLSVGDAFTKRGNAYLIVELEGGKPSQVFTMKTGKEVASRLRHRLRKPPPALLEVYPYPIPLPYILYPIPYTLYSIPYTAYHKPATRYPIYPMTHVMNLPYTTLEVCGRQYFLVQQKQFNVSIGVGSITPLRIAHPSWSRGHRIEGAAMVTHAFNWSTLKFSEVQWTTRSGEEVDVATVVADWVWQPPPYSDPIKHIRQAPLPH